MQRYEKHILGLDITFRTKAEPERVDRAAQMVEERFAALDAVGKNVSREKLLIMVAMGLADDLLESQGCLGEVKGRLHHLVEKIQRDSSSSSAL